MTSPLRIVPLTSETWPALAELFASGGDPRWCWCQYWRKPGSSWSNTTPAENRADLEALVGHDPAPGLVALRDGVAIGWVGLGPKETFPRMERSRTIPQLPGAGVWSINCFVVARGERRRGLAGELLAAAAAYARAHGALTLEGYPARPGERLSAATLYTGSEAMFERAGFTQAGGTPLRPTTGTPRTVMRRSTDGAAT